MIKRTLCIYDILNFITQDGRYSKYIGKMAIVPMTYGRHVPIIADKVNHPHDIYSIIRYMHCLLFFQCLRAKKGK